MSGATLNFNGFSQEMGEGELIVSGTITDSTGSGGTLFFESTTSSNISGTLSGSMNLAKTGGSSSVLTLSGGSANTFFGTTTVNLGTIVLSKTSGVNAIGGDLSIGDESYRHGETRFERANQQRVGGNDQL